MPLYPPQCQAIADEIKRLEDESQSLSTELKCAAPGQKPAIAAQIKKLNAQIQVKRKDLQRCVAAHPLPSSALTGKATIWLPPAASAGTTCNVSGGMTFSYTQNTAVSLRLPTMAFARAVQFSSWGFHYVADLAASTDGSTVGSYNPATHDFNFALSLTLSFPGLSGFLSSLIPTNPSTLTLRGPGLTTGSVATSLSPNGSVSGSPLNTNPGPDLGRVVLVGAGVASGGLLGGKECLLTVSGILAPVP